MTLPAQRPFTFGLPSLLPDFLADALTSRRCPGQVLGGKALNRVLGGRFLLFTDSQRDSSLRGAEVKGSAPVRIADFGYRQAAFEPTFAAPSFEALLQVGMRQGGGHCLCAPCSSPCLSFLAGQGLAQSQCASESEHISACPSSITPTSCCFRSSIWYILSFASSLPRTVAFMSSGDRQPSNASD